MWAVRGRGTEEARGKEPAVTRLRGWKGWRAAAKSFPIRPSPAPPSDVFGTSIVPGFE